MRTLILAFTAFTATPVLVAQTSNPPQWAVGVHYVAGIDVTYGGFIYVDLQTHTSQIDWTPPATPALWKLIGPQGGSGCTSAPQAPTGLTGTSSGPTGATLTWKAAVTSSGCAVSSYTVYENENAIATTSATNFNVTGLSAGTTYAFTVTASDSAGHSALSSSVLVTTPSGGGGNGPCDTPWNGTVVYTGGMTASVGGVNYVANWWTQGQSPSTNSGPAGSGQPWTVVGLCAACAAVPSVPGNLTAGSVTSTRVSLNWTAASVPPNCSLSNYAIFRNGVAVGTSTTTSFVSSGLTPSTAYSFSVAAVDLFGSSTQSALLAVTTSASSGGPTRTFAPYIDMSMTTSEQLATIQQQSGIGVFTLAFVLGNGTCTPYWGGATSVANDALPDGSTIAGLIQSVRNAGGDVIVSFGGANGTELALTCPNVQSLQAAYQTVVTKYGLTMIDFDIEGGAVADPVSIARRDQALVALKAANPGLTISYTLPVLPTGLDSNGMKVLQQVKSDGLALDVVNVMAMDYGASVDNGGQMGIDATQAAQNTYSQILAAGLKATVGVTPMIGVNDVSPETFELTDATTLLNFALANPYITRLAMWSVGRDNGSCGGTNWASADCSGLVQTPYQFSKIFEGFQ